MKVYIAKQNSDLTEGKGRMVPIGYYLDETEAVNSVQNKGVMGVGPGEVWEVEIHDDLNDFKKDIYDSPEINPFKETMTYGYRQDWTGKWNYGFIDLRDKPDNDPEFAEYARLKKKFEGE